MPAWSSAQIDGVQKYFNVSNLLASYVLNKDVTDNEYGILLTDTGMWIESAADRTTLCTRLKLKRNDSPPSRIGLYPPPGLKCH